MKVKPNTNKYKLNRFIPSDVKREVRTRCGFGCVICGSAIYQYEHFNPEFKDAQIHNPDGITLLCGGCHDRKTRGILSKETVKIANSFPFAKKTGHSWGPFDIGVNNPKIILGNLIIENTPIPIRIFGDKILKITPPENSSEPFKITAFVKNSFGNIIMQIKDNEWLTPSTNWDIQVEGPRIKINSSKGKIDLILRTEPPNILIFEKFSMAYRGYILEGQENDIFQIKFGNKIMKTKKVHITESEIGINIDNNSIGFAYCGKIKMGDKDGPGFIESFKLQ